MLTVIVAVFGTTISPYLFFWQAAQEVEDVDANPKAHALKQSPSQARSQFRRINIDTYVGMGLSNSIALFIMIATAATLAPSRRRRYRDVGAGGRSVAARLPVRFAFLLFSLGIIGTGMLAIPVLAGSAAYAVAETFRWRRGLDRKLREARRLLRDHRLRDAWRSRAYLQSDRSDQGAVLERGHQRRHLRARPDRDDAARRQSPRSWGNSLPADGSSSSAGWRRWSWRPRFAPCSHAMKKPGRAARPGSGLAASRQDLRRREIKGRDQIGVST